MLFFGPKSPDQNAEISPIKALDDHYAVGQLVQFQIENPADAAKNFDFKIAKRTDGKWKNIFEKTISVPPKDKKTISFSEKNTELFPIGKFRAQLFDGDHFAGETEFAVEKAGFFRSLFRAIFFRPIENLLLFFLIISKNHLWIAIILLTIFVKILLLLPSKKGIIAQQKMQNLQPEIEKTKNKFAHDPQRQATEMMALWKKHGVNPAGAFLPMLVQFPVLIALFFVIKSGLAPHNSYLIYPISALQNFDFSAINFHFLWMDLSRPDRFFVLPILVGLLQFWQMASMEKKRGQKSDAKKNPHESAMKLMKYILPGMVVVFSATMPAAVALYWGISTLFAVGQQYFLQKNPADKKIIDAKIVEKKPQKKGRIRA